MECEADANLKIHPMSFALPVSFGSITPVTIQDRRLFP